MGDKNSLTTRLEALESAVVADIMTTMGLENQVAEEPAAAERDQAEAPRSQRRRHDQSQQEQQAAQGR